MLASLSTVRSARVITANIDYARLDPALHVLLQDPLAIDVMSEVLAVTNRGDG